MHIIGKEHSTEDPLLVIFSCHQWNAFCHSYSIPSSTIQFSHKFKSMSAAECDCFHFSCHHLETISFLNQQSKQSGFGLQLIERNAFCYNHASFCSTPDCFDGKVVLGRQKTGSTKCYTTKGPICPHVYILLSFNRPNMILRSEVAV